MSAPSRFASAVSRRLRALTREVAGARTGDAESLHRLRVASRRLREVLPALAPGNPRPGARLSRVRKQVRRLTRALGAVRELDVTLALVDDLHRAHPDLREALALVRGPVEARRQDGRVAMLQTLDRIDPMALAARIGDLARQVDTPQADASRRRRLAARIGARAEALAGELDAVGLMYAPHRLHPVRIAAKKLRYALELAVEFHAVPTLALTRRLKRVQDLLGQLHDLEVLAGWCYDTALLPATPDRALPPLVSYIEQGIVRLHAEYFRHRPLLVTVLGRCRTRVRPALTAPPSTPRPPRRVTSPRRPHA